MRRHDFRSGFGPFGNDPDEVQHPAFRPSGPPVRKEVSPAMGAPVNPEYVGFPDPAFYELVSIRLGQIEIIFSRLARVGEKCVGAQTTLLEFLPDILSDLIAIVANAGTESGPKGGRPTRKALLHPAHDLLNQPMSSALPTAVDSRNSSPLPAYDQDREAIRSFDDEQKTSTPCYERIPRQSFLRNLIHNMKYPGVDLAQKYRFELPQPGMRIKIG